MNAYPCPFCTPAEDRVFYRSPFVVGLWDAYPVSAGHALLVPVRHVAHWFDASPDEQAELLRALNIAKAAVEVEHTPDGYNIGINVGRAAGQTVFHLHVHLIPRYDGDVPDPAGGVRHVIPAAANYLAALAPHPSGTLPNGLVTGGSADPLLPHLLTLLDDAEAVDVAVAFTFESGVRLIEEHLRDVLARDGSVRILTGDYLGATEPTALYRLLDLQGDVELRVFASDRVSFHPKAYVVRQRAGVGTAFVGSSNLTETALRRGVEWNYRVITSRDEAGYIEVVRAFDELWQHPSVQPLDADWVRAYEARRTVPVPRIVGLAAEPIGPPPEPHPVQAAALEALAATRGEGNTAGLVVLATGLGKTWLSAFDSNRAEYRRVLFIAHREEILTQALRTFRTIRPQATLGYYNGEEKTPDADVLFASIQTLGKRRHLDRFDTRHFDYIVVDEFHHAAAQTYRRTIGHFEPRFLLGLTATPGRTDGRDLLALCGDNLVYRCDVAEGIRRGLLSPFAYLGVPDEVDYANIPWRSSRFDENALTAAVATRTRAENALQQLRRHGLQRTIAFCVSQRHADFMADYFAENGLRAAAVHAGPSSAPRAHSLERLEAGELDVICAVDMFNEGVDLPHVDTILMLRPTESRILWLQQFGRGLRYLPGKTLRVIDYIGNHRVFLTKARALFDLGSADREVAFALAELDAGTMELPPGCSVTYDLQAIDILRSLLRPDMAGDQLRRYYQEFRESHGSRPLALQTYEDGYNPRAARRSDTSWFDFVAQMGDLADAEAEVRSQIGSFLDQREVTPMTKSYKMLVLLAMLGQDAFPGSIEIEQLVERFSELVRRYATIRQEVGEALDDPAALRRVVESNPIAAWTGGSGTGGVCYFSYDGARFSTAFSVPPELREAAQDLAGELAEWRLTEYLRRHHPRSGADRFVCRVSHANGRPILFLPSRETTSGLPEGWQDVYVGNVAYQAKFVKVAVNVISRPSSAENVLPELLREWFGESAGQPGRTDAVLFERRGHEYVMRPAGEDEIELVGPVPWSTYSRDTGMRALNLRLKNRWERQSGIVERPDRLVFFVTLDKGQHAEEYQYKDRFLSLTEFEWQSQNRTRQNSALGRQIRQHRDNGTAVHLFVRKMAKVRGKTQDFYYAGELEFQRWEGEAPITVWWRVTEEMPERLWEELGSEPTPPVHN
jgi:superfamily II DNA or RNA helicase/HKD family nuclease/diadenosine tetraphosphate (Ap4A) HIT family hydrolase